MSIIALMNGIIERVDIRDLQNKTFCLFFRLINTRIQIERARKLSVHLFKKSFKEIFFSQLHVELENRGSFLRAFDLNPAI